MDFIEFWLPGELLPLNRITKFSSRLQSKTLFHIDESIPKFVEISKSPKMGISPVEQELLVVFPSLAVSYVYGAGIVRA